MQWGKTSWLTFWRASAPGYPWLCGTCLDHSDSYLIL